MWRTAEMNSLALPPMRSKMASTVLGTKLYLQGGLGGGSISALWSLDLATMRWEQCMNGGGHSMRGQPAPRSAHTLTADGVSSLVLFGGQGNLDDEQHDVDICKEKKPNAMQVRALACRAMRNDLWHFDVDAGRWVEHPFVGKWPSPRRIG